MLQFGKILVCMFYVHTFLWLIKFFVRFFWPGWLKTKRDIFLIYTCTYMIMFFYVPQRAL